MTVLGSTRFLYLDNIDYHIDIHHIRSSWKRRRRVPERMLGNKNIHWEVAWKQNYAIDLSLFDDLDLTFDYFIEDRSDILIREEFQFRLSQDLHRRNYREHKHMGEIKNKGYEITLDYNKNITRDLNVNLGGNFSYARNKVISADEAILSADYAYRYRETGFSLGQNWGYVIDRTV